MISIAQPDPLVNGSSVPTCLPSGRRPQISAEILAANNRLLKRRTELLPRPRPYAITPWSLRIVRNDPPPKPPTAKTIAIHPALLTAFIKNRHVPSARIWLLARLLDTQGSGQIALSTLHAALSKKGSPQRIASRRRLNQLLKAGEGRFWQRDKNNRLWLRGAARVAIASGLRKMAGKPILLPTKILFARLAEVKAAFFAAIHQRPADASPISRHTLHHLTGVSPRTQRHYDRLSHAKKQTTYALGAEVSAESHQNAAYHHGNATFIFTDHRGRHGAAGRKYSAWQLPNRYSAPYQSAANGRRRKINQQLRQLENDNVIATHTDLVQIRARGNGAIQAVNSSSFSSSHYRPTVRYQRSGKRPDTRLAYLLANNNRFYYANHEVAA